MPSFYWKFQLHDDHGQGDDYAYEVDYRENTEDDYYGIPEDVGFLEEVLSVMDRFDNSFNTYLMSISGWSLTVVYESNVLAALNFRPDFSEPI